MADVIRTYTSVNQCWQVSANSGLNRPGRNRFLTVFTKHGTTTAAVTAAGGRV